MILQKFISTTAIINEFLEKCFDDEFDLYLFQFLDGKNFNEIDIFFEKSSCKISKRLEVLSEQKSISNCITIVKDFSLNEKLVLNQHFTVAALHKGFCLDKLPLFPIENIPLNFFAFLELSYQDFCELCQRKGISAAETAFSLSLDNHEQQNG